MNGATPTVLIVDADGSRSTALEQSLQADFALAFAKDGPEALAVVHLVQPDVILLDAAIAESDHCDVCARLKDDDAAADIPVIFITDRDDPTAESRGLELGAADHVSAPFHPGLVRARVRAYVELKRAREALELLAVTDAVTGLANRRRFRELLGAEIKRLARTGAYLSLILLDVDYFKAYSDHYGEVAGDDCLRKVGDAISAELKRGPDLAARFGGEEFACILPDTQLPGAVAVAERIQARIAAHALPNAAAAEGETLTASIGVVSFPCKPQTLPEDLLRAADARLFEAKLGGRNRIVAEPDLWTP